MLILFLLLATLSPLSALIFATDSFRWIGWALFNNVSALVILFLLNEKYGKIILAQTKKKLLAIVFAITTALLLGYFTVFAAYPIIEKYFPIVYSFFFG